MIKLLTGLLLQRVEEVLWDSTEAEAASKSGKASRFWALDWGMPVVVVSCILGTPQANTLGHAIEEWRAETYIPSIEPRVTLEKLVPKANHWAPPIYHPHNF